MFYPASVSNLYSGCNANEIVPECKWNENAVRIGAGWGKSWALFRKPRSTNVQRHDPRRGTRVRYLPGTRYPGTAAAAFLAGTRVPGYAARRGCLSGLKLQCKNSPKFVPP
eukprot:1654257-Rhodomonas_salina.3